MSEKEYPVKIDEAELAKRVAPNCLEVKPNFIQDVDGHLFMHQLKTMQLSS